ncbi:MAG TPA: DinB family protein [Gemmatimonadaceae bacterium]
MKDFLDDFRATLAAESIRLMAITDEKASQPPFAGKWSPKEVVGHLIDSASNNHARFVRAQLNDEMVFPRYDQDAWVKSQRYNERAWMELVSLWRAYNTHIAWVIEGIAQDRLSLPRSTHNLDEIAWNTVPRDKPVTLEYFIRDYLGHMKHHLSQIK